MATTMSSTTLSDTISSANAVLERTVQNAIEMAKSANSAFRRKIAGVIDWKGLEIRDELENIQKMQAE